MDFFSKLRRLIAEIGALAALAIAVWLGVERLGERGQDDAPFGESRDRRSNALATAEPLRNLVPNQPAEAKASTIVPMPPVVEESLPRSFEDARGRQVAASPARWQPVQYVAPSTDGSSAAAPPATGFVPLQEHIPVGDPNLPDKVRISLDKDLISITAQGAPLSAVLNLLAQQHGINLITSQEVNDSLTATLKDVRLPDALDALLAVHGYTWTLQNNILYVTSVDAKNKTAPAVQGRVLRVFPLNYVAASEVDKVVKGLMSPVGQSFVLETSPKDQRRTQEQIVVEDLPGYLLRVEQYIQNIDFQPRQVVVEARVLQVKLTDDMRHGINFERLFEISGTNVTFQTTGFVNPLGTPGGFIRIAGNEVNSVVEALQSTTDTKTLASPKVAVLNGQEARIQIGGQIGYLTSTSTMTSTVQTVNFLDTGVILTVTPLITAEGQVLLSVKPEVSTGRINPTTTLPESETTQVETRVLLADGEAVVIGGLISEKDIEQENKLPWLGNIKYIGWLFRRKVYERERNEVIVTLMPRIVSDVPGCRQANPSVVIQAATPLFSGQLTPVDRTLWEPRMQTARQPILAPRPPIFVESRAVFETSPTTEATVPNGAPLFPPPAPLPEPPQPQAQIPEPAPLDPPAVMSMSSEVFGAEPANGPPGDTP